jgi:spore germination cell wall hydrolase CwlJ-like protein
MTDLTPDLLLALCLWSEAAREPRDGRIAVAKVVTNRMRDRYFSDGTVTGTVLAKDQFSGFWFSFNSLHGYHRVANTIGGAMQQADRMLSDVVSKCHPGSRAQLLWAKCQALARAAVSGTLDGYFAAEATGAEDDLHHLEDALHYYNPAIVHDRPSFVMPGEANFLVAIGHHRFYAKPSTRSS